MRAALILLPTLIACDARSAADLTHWVDAGEPLGVAHLPELVDVYLTQDGPPVRLSGTQHGGLILDVLGAEDRLAVHVADEDLELLLWVERDDAIAWTRTETSGAATPTSDPVIDFVTGTPTTVLDTRTDAVRVLYEGERLLVDAWVPSQDIDEVRRVGVAPSRLEADDIAHEVLVELPVELLDAPDGGWIGELHEMEGRSGWGTHTQDDTPVMWVEGDGQATPEWMPVAYRDGRVTVHAWVPRDSVVDPHGPLGGHGWGSSRCLGFARTGARPSPRALGGSLIYDGPDGTPIGEVHVDQRVQHAIIDDAFGWIRAEIATPAGDIPVWFDPDDVAWPRFE